MVFKGILIIFTVVLLCMSFSSAISVEQAELLELGDDGFVVGWNLNQGGSGSIHYGTTGSLGSTTTFEPRFLEYHQQQVDGLQPNTVYFYRAIGKDANGNAYSSAISLTRTAGILNNPEPSPTPDPQPNTPPSSSTISLPSYGSPDYYVATNGKSTNNGQSKSTPWDIQTAFSRARAGDTVFIHAGDYGNLRLTQNNDGTASKYISFIGTDSNWNPMDSRNTGRTFNRGATVDANIMPLLRGAGSTTIKYTGSGITIRGDYVRLENFQFTKHDIGIQSFGSNQIIKNVYTSYHGDFRPGLEGGFENYAGRSINLYGDNPIVIDSLFQDAGSQGLTIHSENGRYDNIMIDARNNNNDLDYDFLFGPGAINNVATNIYSYRVPGMDHQGHGIVFKSGGGQVTGNLVDGFLAENSRVELQFLGTKNNIVRNGRIYTTNSVDSEYNTRASYSWRGGIFFANGASNNLVENVNIKNVNGAIVFNDWRDGVRDGDGVSAGFSNTVRRITADGGRQAIWFNQHPGHENGLALNNRIEDSTFRNFIHFISVEKRPNSGNIFKNIIVENIGRFPQEAYGGTLNKNTVFDCIKLVNTDFSADKFTPYNEKNINGNCKGAST